MGKGDEDYLAYFRLYRLPLENRYFAVEGLLSSYNIWIAVSSLVWMLEAGAH